MYKKLIFFLLMQTVFGASLTENEVIVRLKESLPLNPITDENAIEIEPSFNEMGGTLDQDLLAPQNVTSKNSSILISTLHHGRIAYLASSTNPNSIPSELKNAEPSEVSTDSTFFSSLSPINSSVTQSNISYEPLDSMVDTTEDSYSTGLYDEYNLTMNATNYIGTSNFHEIETSTDPTESNPIYSDLVDPTTAKDQPQIVTTFPEHTESSSSVIDVKSIPAVSSFTQFPANLTTSSKNISTSLAFQHTNNLTDPLAFSEELSDLADFSTLSEETSDFTYPSVTQTTDFQFSTNFFEDSTEPSDFFHTDSLILPVSSAYKFSDVPNLRNSIASSRPETEALSDISFTLQNPDKVSKIQFESQVQKFDTASRTKTIAEVDETIVEMTKIESAKEAEMSEFKLTEADAMTLLESNVRLTKANATKTKENTTQTDYANAATNNANKTKAKETNKNFKTKVAKTYSTSTGHANKTTAESTETEASKNVTTLEESEINAKMAVVGSEFNTVAERLVFDARITIEIIDEFKESFVSELLDRNWSEAEIIYPLGSVNEPFLIPVPDLKSHNIANLTTGLLESYQMLQQYAVALEYLTLDLVLSGTHGYMTQVTEVSSHLEFTLDDLKISILDHGLVPFNDKTSTVVYKYPDLPINQNIRDFAILRDTRVALQDVQDVFSDL